MIKALIRGLACGICKALSEPPTPVEEFKPDLSKRVPMNDLWLFLQGKFPGIPIYLSDQHYYLVHYDDIARFLAEDETNKMGYLEEDRDCDDFAYRLLGQFSIPEWSGLTLGLVWTDRHALNCVVTEDMKFFFIEPQTDELKEALDPWQGSVIRFIMI